MTTYADLEIAIHRRDADSYAIELRFTLPDSDAEVRLVQGGPALAHFDVAGLRALAMDVAAYSDSLSGSLFQDPAVKGALSQARSSAQAADVSLRVRLFVDPSAPELHSQRWEVLRDPQDGNYLFTGEQVLFSPAASIGGGASSAEGRTQRPGGDRQPDGLGPVPANGGGR